LNVTSGPASPRTASLTCGFKVAPVYHDPDAPQTATPPPPLQVTRGGDIGFQAVAHRPALTLIRTSAAAAGGIDAREGRSLTHKTTPSNRLSPT
jgi:hypothetical protein